MISGGILPTKMLCQHSLLSLEFLGPGLSYYMKGLKADTEENTATIHSKCPCGHWNVNVLHTAGRTGHPHSIKLL